MKKLISLMVIGLGFIAISRAEAMEIIDLTGGGPYTARISNHSINRIALPFPAKEIILQKDAPVDTKVVGKNLFITMLKKDFKDPVEIYILFESQDPVGLTLQPSDMRGETLVLKSPFAATQKAVKWEQSVAYEKGIKELVRKMALDEVPDGYTLEEGEQKDVSPWKETSIQRHRSYRGGTYIGEVYSILNTSTEMMTLDEDELVGSFLGSNIKAVSIQNRKLEAGRQTLVYVVRGSALMGGGLYGK